MKIIEQSYEILEPIHAEQVLKKIEMCGRLCYKSEDKITDDSAGKFVSGIVKRGHEAVLEHATISVRFITDRAVTHEIVRHRLASYCQESQRYVKYGDVEFIRQGEDFYGELETLLRMIENDYSTRVKLGAKPEIARAVLPNCTKTEIIMTANLREWRHFLKLRTHKTASPQMRALVTPLLNELKETLPDVFGDIE